MAAERLAEGLARLGYALEPGEAARLLEAVARDGDESVPKAKFLASQLDWAAYQMNFRRALASTTPNPEQVLIYPVWRLSAGGSLLRETPGSIFIETQVSSKTCLCPLVIQMFKASV